MVYLYTFLVTIGIITAFFALMNIKYFFNGQVFRGSCAQNNPLIKNSVGDCQMCGKKADEVCKMPEAHG